MGRLEGRDGNKLTGDGQAFENSFIVLDATSAFDGPHQEGLVVEQIQPATDGFVRESLINMDITQLK